MKIIYSLYINHNSNGNNNNSSSGNNNVTTFTNNGQEFYKANVYAFV